MNGPSSWRTHAPVNGRCYKCRLVLSGGDAPCSGFAVDPADDYDDIADHAMDGGCLDVEGMTGGDDA